MTIETYAILIGIILILIDIFFPSDIPTFLAILLFCFAFFRKLPFSLPVNIILTILFFFTILITFLTLWRKMKGIVVDKWFAKDIYKAGIYNFPGKKGIVYVVDGEKFAMIDGDLYGFYDNCDLAENASFIVKEVKDGKIVIS